MAWLRFRFSVDGLGAEVRPVLAKVIRRMGISKQTFYRWMKL
ncbi:hypothetical protein NRB_28370 [Novosphingobium sp. 11B]